MSITLFGFLSTTFWGMVLARGLNGALSGNGSVSKAALGEMTDRTNEGQSVSPYASSLGRVRSRPPRVEMLTHCAISLFSGLAFPLFSLQWSLGLALGCIPDQLCCVFSIGPRIKLTLLQSLFGWQPSHWRLPLPSQRTLPVHLPRLSLLRPPSLPSALPGRRCDHAHRSRFDRLVARGGARISHFYENLIIQTLALTSPIPASASTDT